MKVICWPLLVSFSLSRAFYREVVKLSVNSCNIINFDRNCWCVSINSFPFTFLLTSTHCLTIFSVLSTFYGDMCLYGQAKLNYFTHNFSFAKLMWQILWNNKVGLDIEDLTLNNVQFQINSYLNIWIDLKAKRKVINMVLKVGLNRLPKLVYSYPLVKIILIHLKTVFKVWLAWTKGFEWLDWVKSSLNKSILNIYKYL